MLQTVSKKLMRNPYLVIDQYIAMVAGGEGSLLDGPDSESLISYVNDVLTSIALGDFDFAEEMREALGGSEEADAVPE